MRWAVNLMIVLASMATGIGQPALAQARPTPPKQPAIGPGGTDYDYLHIDRARHREPGGSACWVFEPAQADKTKPMPVIVYVHGLNAADYNTSWLWIRHMVRKGNIVLYPQYQRGLLLDPKRFTNKTAAAIGHALDKLDGKRHVKADTERFALVGHSLGGAIAANLAADHEGYGLPSVGALMAVQPGDVKTTKGLGVLFPSLLEDYSTIPRGTLMLVIATENDEVVGQRLAKRLYDEAVGVPKQDKNHVLIGPDRHGWPGLYDGHLMAWAYIDSRGRARVDAYDYALWRWLDALTDAAFYDGKHRDFALGNTPKQRAMGKWSDGRPVREPVVSDEP